MSQYRTLNRTLLLKVEGTPGTDASPTVGSDAILCERILLSPPIFNRSRRTRSPARSTIAARSAAAPGPGDLHGDRQAQRHGRYGAGDGPALRACGMQETVTASAITGTASAGTTSTLTIEGADISADDQPTACRSGSPAARTPAIRASSSTAWTRAGRHGVLDRGGGVRQHQRLQHRHQCPLRAGEQRPGLGLDLRLRALHTDAGNSRLNKLLGAQGTWGLSLPVRDVPRFNFTFTGKAVAPSDVSHPGAATYDTNTAFPFLDAGCYLSGITSAMKINSLQLDYGATVQAADDPSAALGYDLAGITRRRVGGTIVPPKSLLSAFNAFTSWQSQTEYSFAAWWGRAPAIAWRSSSRPCVLPTGPIRTSTASPMTACRSAPSRPIRASSSPSGESSHASRRS